MSYLHRRRLNQAPTHNPDPCERPATERLPVAGCFFFCPINLRAASPLYRSSSAATTLIDPKIATTSLTRCPSVIFAIDE